MEGVICTDADYRRSACLKDIPDHLIFHLKRFEFNLKAQQRNKINDYFPFPNRIDMRPYTVDQLNNPAEELPPDEFELVGVLVHSGTAESGHYYSYIRERPTSAVEEKWLEFNDDVVSTWDPTMMESSCYGGLDYRNHFDGGMASEKSYSAYMLFYQRSSSLQAEQENLLGSGMPSPVRAELSQELDEHIRLENRWIVRRHCLYDQSHISFILVLLTLVRQLGDGECSADHVLEDVSIRMSLSHLDQVASRAKEVPDFLLLVHRLDSWCHSCARCCLGIFEYFNSRHEAWRQLIQRNPEPLVRLETGNLVMHAIEGIRVAMPGKYGLVGDEATGFEGDGELGDDTVLKGMAAMFGVLWDYFHNSLRAWPETFGLMLSYVSLGRQESAMFMDSGFLRLALQMITADQSMQLDQQFARLVNTLQRRLPGRQPSYDKVISLVNALLSVAYIPFDPRSGAYTLLDTRSTGYVSDEYAREKSVLQDPAALLPLTRSEASLIMRDWGRGYSNIFMEKLICLNQNHAATELILERLLEIHTAADQKLLTTLKIGIVHASPAFNAPYLRAALVYCRRSAKIESVRTMMEHVAITCQSLQTSDGRIFLHFFREQFHGGANLGEDWNSQQLGLEQIPTWTPALLGYYDTAVGVETESFLQEVLFGVRTMHNTDENADGSGLSVARMAAARQLGLECLIYLKEFVVSRNIPTGNHTIAGLQRVIGQCKEYYDFAEGSHDELAEEYVQLVQSE
jgi:ubiquitin carboxyl-terminal hydrolase 34